MKLLVLTIENYQDIELVTFVSILKSTQKIQQIDFWNPDNNKKVKGSNEIGYIESLINEVNVNNYDAIFVPGGKSCINLRKNKKALNLIKQFIDLDKYIFAICDAPNALIESGMLLDKKYVSYPIENINKKATSLRQKDNKIFRDGKYITGDSPCATIDFALLVINTYFDERTKLETFKKINGGL